MLIAHISDLHFGAQEFKKGLENKLLSTIAEAAPHVTVITGDITENGYFHEYAKFERFYKELEEHTQTRVIVCPGNHDARNNGLYWYRQIIGKTTRFTFVDKKVAVCILDSTRDGEDAGFVSHHQLEMLHNRLPYRKKDLVSIVCLHHPVLPIPNVVGDAFSLYNAGNVLQAVINNFDYVLCGHLHRPWVWETGKTKFVAAGTATTVQYKGRQSGGHSSFYFIDTEKDIIKEINL